MCDLVRPWNWLIYRIVNPALEERFRLYAKGRMVDIGCGTKPYRELAKPFITEHVGVDHAESIHDASHVDLSCTAYELPVEDNAFDTVLCTDVLEHLEDPQRAVEEAARVLIPGGYAIYTVPLFWHIHEAPRDYYRYTKYGLRYLFTRGGFEVVEATALTGFTVTFCQALVYFLYGFRGRSRWNPLRWVIPPLGWLIQWFAFAVHHVEMCEAFTAEYILVARKPPRAS